MNNNLQKNPRKERQADKVAASALDARTSGVAPKSASVVIAVASGSSGVGKSTVAVNVAIALARASSRVCVFDAGKGSVNATALLGVPPEFSISRFFKANRPSVKLLPAGPEGVRVFPAASKLAHFLPPKTKGRSKVADGLDALENDCDYLILDLCSDMSSATLQFAGAAQIVLLVITPDPKSLSRSFLLLRTLQRRAGSDMIVQVVINLAENARSAAVIYQRFSETVKKYLHIQTEFLGSVWSDRQLGRPTFGRWLAAQMPITEPVCRTFFRLARRLIEISDQKKLPNTRFSSCWRPVKPSVRVHAALVGSGKNSATTERPIDAAAAYFAQKPMSEDKAWRKFRTQLSRYLLNKSDRTDYIADLLAVCLALKGDAATTPGFTEPVLGLLGELSPVHLNAEQRSRLSDLVKRLLGECYELVSQSSALKSATHPEYDRQGFGNQQELLQKLRESSSTQSLNNLLDSIKYASKVNALDSSKNS